MLVNADFSQVAVVKSQDYQWVKSPRGEVERVMLDRIGAEHARATSIVKYLPHTVFPQHQHPNGEEILVLSGVFTENTTTHYPAGWYLRSPHDSSHSPSSEQGALIFVKLRQMDLAEKELVRINTNDTANWKHVDGRHICALFHSEHEHTYLENLESEQRLMTHAPKGLEIFVLSGQLHINHADLTDSILEAGSWIRLPSDVYFQCYAGVEGTALYVKTNHLPPMVTSNHGSHTFAQPAR